MAVASGHSPLEVGRWPIGVLMAMEAVYVDRADHAKIEEMKRGGHA